MNTKISNEGPPEYDFEAATEAERWAYDQGYEAAFDPAEMALDDIEVALQACIDAVRRMIAEAK